MSFWQGFAQAFKDSDEKKTQDRRLQEEREFIIGQKIDDRKWEEDFFFRKLKAETEAERQNLFLSGRVGAGRGATGSTGTRGSDDSAIPLEALVRAHPELDPELVAQLAPYPDAIKTVFEELNSKKTEWANSRQAWSPETSNSFIRAIVTSGDEEISQERILEVAEQFNIDPTAPIFPGGPLGSDVIRDRLAGDPTATVLFNPEAAPDPMKPEEIRLYRETVESRMKGYLTTQLQALKAEYGTMTDTTDRTNSAGTPEATDTLARIQALEGLISQVDEGFLDEALSSEYGTRAMMDLWNSGDRTEYQRMFPSFKPHFTSAEEAKEALAAGFVRPGQSLMVLVDGTYRQARF